jgi:hypothetical protein
MIAAMRAWARPAAIVVAGLVVAVVVWVVLDRTNDDPEASPPTATILPATTPSALSGPIVEPEIASMADLSTLASRLPFYWAGQRAGKRVELTSVGDGTVYIRYVPPTARAGSTGAALTVATYPRPNAFAEVSSAAAKDGATKLDLAGGGIAVVDATNVHLAYPGDAYQVEVYSPKPGLARRLVTSGTVVRFQ